MKRTKSFDNSHPVLYLIATPIGNLSEISERALATIKEMDIIAAEDTRNTGFLLNRYGFSKELFSLREHNENEASSYLISLIKNGKKVAYVSDAGYPGISDPGYLLVKNALKEGIAVSTISGPSAFINALVASGLETNHFYFHGFLPAKDSEAKDELESLKNKKETLIFYESPHRIHRMLENLFEKLGDRNAVIARELTKVNEEYVRGTLSELVSINEQELKGEMVIIVEGSKEEESISDQFLIDKVNNLVQKGLSKKDAIDVVSDHFMVNKNRIKKLVL